MAKAAIKITGVFLFTALSWCGCVLASPAESFHFTVTTDPHGYHATFNKVCQAINDLAGGPGAFCVSGGDDVGQIWENRAIIDAHFGTSTIWYPVISNHDAASGVTMEWLRDEYDNGNNLRTPLKDYTNQNGPTGTVRTNYSWDYGNIHFIALNEYWNGGTNEGSGTSTSGSDTAASGDIVPALYNWLAADLASCTKPFIFVVGHEPAFPFYRHVGDSLDAHKANRNAFWDLLETESVTAYICGHTHYYSAHQGDVSGIGSVWQFCAGNAGNDEGDGQTFLSVIVDSNVATLNVYRNGGTATFTKTDSFEFTPRTVIGSFDPSKYTPGESVLVSLAVKPDVSIEAYTVEDSPPSGWTVSNINNGGVWDDVNNKVRWGPFADNSQRTFTYNALPPEDISSSQCFAGKASVNGINMICDRCIESAAASDIYKFGTFAGHKNVPLKVTDSNGTAVTFNLSGGGWGEISDTNFNRIMLYETTEKSAFTIKTTGARRTSVGDIIAEGPLKSILAGTTDFRGDISVNGSLGTLTANNTAESHNVIIDGSIKSVKVAGTLSGEWACAAIKSISAGKVVGANLVLSQKPDTKIPALGNLTVKGWIDSSQILSAGNISTVTAGAMINSTCFAGVADDVSGLPDPAADINYAEPAAIKKIAVKGIKGEEYCFINSNIAAAQILSASLAYLENNNDGVPFGLSAGLIKALKIKDVNGTQSWKNLDNPADAPVLSGDAEIRLY